MRAASPALRHKHAVHQGVVLVRQAAKVLIIGDDHQCQLRFDGRQNAIEAHTVYRVYGKAICVIARNGQTLFDSAEDFRLGGGLKPSDQAGELGLTGEQYMEYVSKEIGRHLRERYTSALKKRFACHCGHRKCRGTMLAPKTKR